MIEGETLRLCKQYELYADGGAYNFLADNIDNPNVIIECTAIRSQVLLIKASLYNECAWANSYTRRYFVERINAYPGIYAVVIIGKFMSRYPSEKWIWKRASCYEYMMNVIPTLPRYILPELNWQIISQSKALTLDFVEEFYQYLYWDHVTRNDAFTYSMMIANDHLPWRTDLFNQNPNTPVDLLCVKPDNMRVLLRSKHLSLSHILAHPNEHWDYHWLCRHIRLDTESVRTLVEIIEKSGPQALAQLFDGLSQNPHITCDIIDAFPMKLWDMEFITIRSQIDIDILVEKYRIPSVYMLKSKKLNWIAARKYGLFGRNGKPGELWPSSALETVIRNPARWSPNDHKYFPRSVRRTVVAILIVCRRFAVPYEIIIQIIGNSVNN